MQLHVFGTFDPSLPCLHSNFGLPISVQALLCSCDVLQPRIAAMLAYALTIYLLSLGTTFAKESPPHQFDLEERATM